MNPVIISPARKKELNDSLMLFFTGFSRFSSDIQAVTQGALQDNESRLIEMLSLVDEAEKILTSKCDLNEFGRLLDHTWKLKRGIADKVSSDSIDALYDKAIRAGATGGKLLSAAAEVFCSSMWTGDRQKSVREALGDLLYAPFEFEDGGTRVVHFSPETYMPAEEPRQPRCGGESP